MAQNRSTKTYRSDDHTNRMVRVMNQMRKDAILCDVTLITSDGEIPSHKMILAACSPYFYTIFTNSGDNQQNKITLNGINSQALSSILEYIYTSEIEITEGNVQDILIAVNLLQLTDLRDVCRQFLKDSLNSTNCLAMRADANYRDFQDLLKDVENFILENFSDVAKSQDFLQLSHDEVSGIISKDELKVVSEATVFESVLTWIKHDLEMRQRHFASLVKNIRVCFLSKDYIAETLLEEPLLKDDPQCQGFIIEAFKHYVSKIDSRTTGIKPRKYQSSSKILLVAGGQTTKKSVEYYDFKQKCWSKLADMPTDRDGAGLTVLNGKVYILGGSNENRVDIYDTATDKWSPGIGMQFKRQYLGVTVLNNCIYAVGGCDDEGYLNTVEKFDLETEQWSVVAPMLTKRAYHGVEVIGGILYAVGGCVGCNTDFYSVESYNPTTNTWTYVKNMHFKRSDVAVGVLNGMLYVVGGHDGSSCLKSVEAFNPNTGNWTMIKDLHNCRYAAAAVTANNLLYVIGGLDGPKGLTSLEVYDPNTMTWTLLPSCMSIGRYRHCAAIIDKFSSSVEAV